MPVEKYRYLLDNETKPFEKWLLRHEYTVVTEAACLPPQMQTRLVLDKLGQSEFDRLVDHTAPADPSRMSQKDLLDTLKKLFRDKVSITRRRIEILNYRYDKSIPISEHLDRINRHAADFDRTRLTDDSLRILLLLQSFCYSSDNDELKKIALRVVERNLDVSLKDVAAELEAHTNVATSLKTLENPTKHSKAATLNVVHSKRKDFPKKRKSVSGNTSKPLNVKCNGCGGAHTRAKCTFRDAECHKCLKKGHIAKVCRSETEQTKSAKIKNVVTRSVTAAGKRRRHYITTSIYGRTVTFQYDTGSDITLIGKKEWIRVGSPKLIPGDLVEHAGGKKLDIIGKFDCTIRALGRVATVKINVVLRDGVNLFGLDAIDSLNLWSVPLNKLRRDRPKLSVQRINTSISQGIVVKINLSTKQPLKRFKDNGKDVAILPHNAYLNDVLNNFPKLFTEELSTCHNFKVKFNLADNARPVQVPCRQVAFAMEGPLEEEVKRLISLDIIERVDVSNWTSPIVIVKKQNGKIRLCADYSTGVNNALIDNRHPLPNVESVASKLNGSCFFSLIDLSDAFFQLEIDEAHREITTITTPKGLFRFKRLPFGIRTAPAIFQQAIDATLSNLDGVYAYLDDIIITGSSRRQHDERLHRALQRLQDSGWKLRAEKCHFALEEIKYLGLIINARGISADPDTTSAIANMPKPTCVAEAQSFLGMVNHYGKFIPHLHQMKQPLEDLTRKNRPWIWSHKHDLAVEQIKKIMLSPLLLEHYDPTKTLIVAADACATGIGAVLLQRDLHGHERAVYHMAQSLTDAQRNYSQLEKVTAIERFHKFVWGRRFILQTDHKPLVALLQPSNTKGLKSTTAARLKRWALRLLGYDFKIEYIRTQDFGQADVLSRLIDKFRRDNAEELQIAHISATESELLQLRNLAIDFFGKELREKLKEATKADPLLRSIGRAIKEGWKTTGDLEYLHFKKRSEELSIIEGTLLIGDRLVIPEKLKPKILTALHKGHPGIRRTKQLAREYVYWPNMSKDLENLVRQCDACALNQKLPIKVPVDPWPTATRPMERVHIDYAGPIDGQYLLILVDAYSKFVDVAITSTISANRTVDLCREIFSRYGPPAVLVSDHGTQFTSELFTSFCKEMQITHLLFMVNHPQSNGQAERMVDTVKRAVAKNSGNWKQQLFDFLYSYRYTPCSAAPEEKSPAELFYGRRLNSPFTKWLPVIVAAKPVRPESAIIKRQTMEEQFSKHHGARSRDLAVGDRVVVLVNKDRREQGAICKILSKTRYSIHLDSGKIIDRHINHIWKGGSTFPRPPKDSDDDWIFFQPPVLQTPRQESPLPSDTSKEPATSPEAPTPADQVPELAQDQPTPARPSRTRLAPKRLILDPSTKSYTEW